MYAMGSQIMSGTFPLCLYNSLLFINKSLLSTSLESGILTAAARVFVHGIRV